MSDDIPELPSKEEVYGIHKENNNDEDSNIHFNNQQGKIPFNNYYQRNILNKNQNQNNNNIQNENSLSIIRLSISAVPIGDKQSKISKSMNINYNFNYNYNNNQNDQPNLNEDNNVIPGNNLANKNDNVEENDDKQDNIYSSKTNPSTIKIKKVNYEYEEKENKFIKICYLILFYLSSITNNVILHFIISIVEKIRGLIK